MRIRRVWSLGSRVRKEGDGQVCVAPRILCSNVHPMAYRSHNQWWEKHHIVGRSFKPALILVLDFNGDILGGLF